MIEAPLYLSSTRKLAWYRERTDLELAALRREREVLLVLLKREPLKAMAVGAA